MKSITHFLKLILLVLILNLSILSTTNGQDYFQKYKGEIINAPFDTTIITSKKFLRSQLNASKNNTQLLYQIKKQWSDYQKDLFVKDSLSDKKFSVCQNKVDSLMIDYQQFVNESDLIIQRREEELKTLENLVKEDKKSNKRKIILFTIGGVITGGFAGLLIGLFN